MCVVLLIGDCFYVVLFCVICMFCRLVVLVMLSRLVSDAQMTIDLLTEWFRANMLSVSLTKTCYSLFGLKSINNVDICVIIDNCKLQHVCSCKYLGVIIDEQLNWREHIDHVYGKLIKFTGLFYKIRYLMSWKILTMLYFSFHDTVTENQ